MDSLEKKFVAGGEVVIAQTPMELITILGSCVAVCLWDRKTKTAGMNHYLLPKNDNGKSCNNGGVNAINKLIQSMIDRMAKLEDIEARIFGGGNRFFSDNFLVVGPQNVEVAIRTLREVGIPIVENDTGGQAGRKIIFNTATGNVTVTLVN